MRGDRLEAVAAFLEARPPDVRWVALPLAQLESLFGVTLPGAARQRRAWWSGRRPWRRAGWRVARVDLAAGLVEFERAC
jgi:hypothetical protein